MIGEKAADMIRVVFIPGRRNEALVVVPGSRFALHGMTSYASRNPPSTVMTDPVI